MKFKNEAVRDVLLFFEENIDYEEDKHGELVKRKFYIDSIIENDFFKDLYEKHDYTKKELRYTIEKLIEGKILQIHGDLNLYYEIVDISYDGLQLLSSIHDESTWNKVKSVLKESGIYSLKYIGDVALQFGTTMVPKLVDKFITTQSW